MLSTFVTLALALLGAVQATPVASAGSSLAPTTNIVVSAPDGIRVVTQDLVSAGTNVTIGTGEGGVHADAAASTYPATFFLCKERGCGSCSGYDLSVLPHQTCLIPNFNFQSMYINQPSNEGLPYAVYTGPIGCSAYYQVPRVNTCYNADGYTSWDFHLVP